MAAALHGTATARFEGRAKVHREIQPAAVADSSLQPQRCAKLRTDRLGRIQQLHPQRRPSAIAAAAAAEEKAALRPYRLASVEFRADRNYFPFSRRGKFAYRRVGRGAVAQLGERRNGIAKVRGSIPLGSTTPPSKGLVGPGPASLSAAAPGRASVRYRSSSIQIRSEIAAILVGWLAVRFEGERLQ